MRLCPTQPGSTPSSARAARHITRIGEPYRRSLTAQAALNTRGGSLLCHLLPQAPQAFMNRLSHTHPQLTRTHSRHKPTANTRTTCCGTSSCTTCPPQLQPHVHEGLDVNLQRGCHSVCNWNACTGCMQVHALSSFSIGLLHRQSLEHSVRTAQHRSNSSHGRDTQPVAAHAAAIHLLL